MWMRTRDRLVRVVLAGALGAVALKGVPVVPACAADAREEIRNYGAIDEASRSSDPNPFRDRLGDPVLHRREAGIRAAYPDSAFPHYADSQHFRIHYASSGPDSLPGWPSTAYIDTLSLCLERSYACLHDTLGLPSPVPDGDLGGGSDLIDFYVIDMRSLYIGSVGTDMCAPSGPCGLQCSGYGAIRRNLGPGWRRSTTALEYFQLVQDATNPRGCSDWFGSSTAIWAERAVFPHDSRYTYWMFEWFNTPYLPLWNNGDGYRRLGSAHYWALLDETLGRSFVPELWMRCCGDEWLATLEEMLHERGTSFDETLVKLALWCNATSYVRADGRHFRDALDYPPIRCQAQYWAFPVEAASIPRDQLAREAGSNFIRFRGPGTRDSLRVTFDGSPGLRDLRRVSLVVTRGRTHQEMTVAPDSQGGAQFTVPGWSSCDQVTLIVTNFREASGDLGYTYSARETGALVRPSVSDLACAPNPFSLNTEITFRAQGEPLPAAVEIYDARGTCVRTIRINSNGQGDKRVIWNGADDRGVGVPFGCYFLRARYGSAAETRKVLYVR
jgi:hypothetical protein